MASKRLFLVVSSCITTLMLSQTEASPIDDFVGKGYNDSNPHYQDWFANFTNCGISKKYATLTFDDGPFVPIPEAESDTMKMLDALDELGIPGTFMMLGYRINLYPELAQKIVKRGHSVGSHSFNHPFLMNGTIEQASKQFSKSSEVFEQILGIKPRFLRPPYGELTWEYGNGITAATGMIPYMWNFDTKDWAIVVNKARTQQWPLDMTNYVNSLFEASKTLHGMYPPSIVLLAHEYRSTPAMAATYIKAIQSKGYTFVDLNTCYNQWVADKNAALQCLPECNPVSHDKPAFGPDGLCANPKWNAGTCSQPPTGGIPPVYPDCSLNPCATLNGYSCDPFNKCVNNVPCVPKCDGKKCGDDGCGGTCAPGCGEGSCVNGKCNARTLPDLTKIDMCRPIGVRSFKLTGSNADLQYVANSIEASYEMTGSWDGGFVGLFTLKNVGHCIDNLVIRVTNPEYAILEDLSGFKLVNSAPTPLYPTPPKIDIKWAVGTPLGLEAPHAFAIKYVINPAVKDNLDLMTMPCFPVPLEVVGGTFGNDCEVNAVGHVSVNMILTVAMMIIASLFLA